MNRSKEDWLAATREELERFLYRPESSRVAEDAARSGLTQTEVLALLDRIVQSGSVPARVREVRPLVGRWMLAQGALISIDRIPDLPVVPEVKRLICKEFQFFCQPGSVPEEQFLPEAREFRSMAAVARLRRFIAGQVHWQVSGIPRSWLLQMRLRDATRTLAVIAQMGGFAPCFEAHIPTRGAPFLLERDYKRSYVRIAQSMELQPRIRGIMGCSWMHSDETTQVSPHLGWLNRLFLENGGTLAHMRPATEDSGFLVGSPKRKELYDSGVYRPRNALFIWPRKALLDWANRQK